MLILDFDILQYSHYICKIFKETYHCLILFFFPVYLFFYRINLIQQVFVCLIYQHLVAMEPTLLCSCSSLALSLLGACVKLFVFVMSMQGCLISLLQLYSDTLKSV